MKVAAWEDPQGAHSLPAACRGSPVREETAPGPTGPLPGDQSSMAAGLGLMHRSPRQLRWLSSEVAWGHCSRLYCSSASAWVGGEGLAARVCPWGGSGPVAAAPGQVRMLSVSAQAALCRSPFKGRPEVWSEGERKVKAWNNSLSQLPANHKTD